MNIEISGVSKTYGKLKAVDDISLSIGPGQIIAVLGINGAGKSTLLKLLSGLIPPDKGDVLFDGEKLTRGNVRLKKRLTVLPDYPAAFFDMSPIRHAAMLFKLYEADTSSAEEKLTALFKDFNILPCANAPLAKLSRGQMYKALLSAAISLDVDLWVFDEPFASGMDPSGLTNFRKHVKAGALRGRTIVYTMQIPEVVEGFCDKICILDRGKVIAYDTVDSITKSNSEGKKSLYDFFAEIKE